MAGLVPAIQAMRFKALMLMGVQATRLEARGSSICRKRAAQESSFFETAASLRTNSQEDARER
jgi:hypothetical protein